MFYILSGILANKKVLEADYKKRVVYFGRSLVGEFPKGTSTTEPKQFVIHFEKIAAEAERMSYNFAKDQVQSEYEDILANMPSFLGQR